MFTFLIFLAKNSRFFPKFLRKTFKQLFPELTKEILGRLIPFDSDEQSLLSGDQLIASREILTMMSNLIPRDLMDSRLLVIGPTDPLQSGIAWNTTRLFEELCKKSPALLLQSPNFRNLNKSKKVRVIPFSMIKLLEHQKVFHRYLVVVGNGNHYLDTLTYLYESKKRHVTVLLHDVKIEGIDFQPTSVSMKKGATKKDPLGLYKLPLDTRKILVHSEYAKKLVESNLDRTPMPKVKVLKTGVPLDSHRKVMRAKPKNLIVGTAGFFDFSKNPFAVLDSFAEVARISPDVKFDWVGVLPDRHKKLLLERWKSFGVPESQLNFYGYLDVNSFSKKLSTWTCAVSIRSYSNGESSGVVAELACAGTPVITTDIGSLSELPSEIFKKVKKRVSPKHLATSILELVNLKDDEWGQLSAALQIWSKSHNFPDYSSEIFNELNMR